MQYSTGGRGRGVYRALVPGHWGTSSGVPGQACPATGRLCPDIFPLVGCLCPDISPCRVPVPDPPVGCVWRGIRPVPRTPQGKAYTGQGCPGGGARSRVGVPWHAICCGLSLRACVPETLGGLGWWCPSRGVHRGPRAGVPWHAGCFSYGCRRTTPTEAERPRSTPTPRARTQGDASTRGHRRPPPDDRRDGERRRRAPATRKRRGRKRSPAQ